MIARSPAERREHRVGVAASLSSAVLFGVSAPLAKVLLRDSDPLLLAGMLYLGAGSGLVLLGLVRRWTSSAERLPREARLRGADAMPLAGMIVAGGIAGPVLMLIGLGRVSAVVGSLLLNLEAPLTILLAVVLYREHLSPRDMAGAALTVAGAGVVSRGAGDWWAHSLGVAAIGGACLSWAVDNNLMQRLSGRDPVAVARVKTLFAGVLTTAAALLAGSHVPDAGRWGPALVVGFVSYGLSIVLAVRASRALGAARHASLFAVAPFVGAVAAVPITGAVLGVHGVLAGLLMGAGTMALLTARHEHLHLHEPLEHDHAHVHDVHHQHAHREGEGPTEPHAHPHVHAPIVHAHPHVSDVHHRHRH